GKVDWGTAPRGAEVMMETGDATGSRFMGTCADAGAIVQLAYRGETYRTIFETAMPGGHYDFIANVPHNPMKAQQAEVKRKFGVVARKEMRERDVVVLQVPDPAMPGFKPAN